MKSILIAPDKFKGTYSAASVAEAMKRGVKHFDASIPLHLLPIADGGDGTIDALKRVSGGSIVKMASFDPWMRPLESKYLKLDANKALIELAQTAGLALVGKKKDPGSTTTFGVGVQIRHALHRGAKTIYLAIGGSATNDAGCGMLDALGVVFRNADGISFHPRGTNLGDIAEIDQTDVDPAVAKATFVTLCDVDNPLFGEHGAAYVYAPQKGATPEMVRHLDLQLHRYAEFLQKQYGLDSSFAGAGAAGGTAVAAKLFLQSTIRSGIDTLLELAKFDALLTDCSLVLTGEGRLDEQSYQGKVLSGILRHANRSNVPVVALVGTIDASALPLPKGLLEAHSTRRQDESVAQAAPATLSRLEELAEMAARRHYRVK